jgi:parallel beta-helix repeat protein
VLAALALAGDGRYEISQSSFVTTLVVTTPGSYVFTESVVVTNTDTYVLRVRTNDVAIDLNGFTYSGRGSGSQCGIYQDDSSVNLTVRNGTLRKWGGSGDDAAVRLEGCGNTIRDVTIAESRRGIRGLRDSIVQDCRIMDCEQEGVLITGSNNVIKGCILTRNLVGITIEGDYNLITENTASQNNTDGIRCWEGDGNSIVRNIASGNATNGIEVEDPARGNLIKENHTTLNGASGLRVLSTNNVLISNYALEDSISYNTSHEYLGPLIRDPGWIKTNSPFANFRLP